jgi:hypothetical protein
VYGCASLAQREGRDEQIRPYQNDVLLRLKGLVRRGSLRILVPVGTGEMRWMYMILFLPWA